MLDPDYLRIPRPADPLEQAKAYFGSFSKMADALGYTRQAIYRWESRRSIPRPAARAIELATEGEIPAHLFAHYGDCE